MDVRRMANILKQEYTLGELEERLELQAEDLDEGFQYYVDENYDKVLEFLRQDLWFH